MADELTTTGLHIDDLLTRLDAVRARIRVAVSTILDLSDDQPIGQIVSILNEHQQQLAELIQEIHAGIDPDQATGQTLDAISAITGTYRRAATYGRVDLTLTFTGAATVPAGSLVSVAGDSANQWAIDEDVVASGAGSQSASATSTTPGVVPALAGTITTIVTPVANWSAVTNASAASSGEGRETDTELRLRREIEVQGGGSTSVDSIQAAVSQIEGVLECFCLENDLDVAADSRPPHSVEVVYWTTYTGTALTALNALIAAAIFEEKAGGVRAYGSTIVEHDDSQGNAHQIGMTLAQELELELRYTLVTSSSYPGDAAFSAAVAAAFDLGVGDDVYHSRMVSVALSVPGVEDVTDLDMNLNGAGWVSVSIAVTQRQIATLVAADVTVV